MHVECRPSPSLTTSVPRVRRRTCADRLREELYKLSEGQVKIEAHRETPWASATFAGSRHRIELVFEEDYAVAAAESFIAALPDHEFAIPGQLVADATITSVDHQMIPTQRVIVIAEILLLQDA
ncbi:hypothetical protein MB02_14960 [Croceicoccus estronivorus]|uniref:hypothetical protein n=1 Tax=Croceicoccus estronivorus TaxID=1172626 RepID=UPI00082B3455|nr:hypothetical protein [Croceicoccus estronivorus]OCC22829.1 hypothetical protein MB02_14960 [Croceicoccus estronivorus]